MRAKPWTLPLQPTTWDALLASGVTRQMIRTALAKGRLLRVRESVYLDAALWPDDPREQHLLRAAAEVELFSSAVLSHESAGAAWELPTPGFNDWHESPPSVLLPTGSARTRVGPAVHRIGVLPPSQLVRDPAGRPVTSLARTAVDLAAGLPLPEALAILDAVARRLCRSMIVRPRRADYANPKMMSAVRELFLDAAGSRRPAGLPATIALADARRESVVESLSAGHFHLAGLPAPLLQEPVNLGGYRVYPDFYWREANVIGECDGAVKYADPQGYVREKEREQRLRDRGFRVVRWLAKEIMLNPGDVVARIARALNT